MLTRTIRTVLIACAIAFTGLAQADSVKIGFITTLTTPAGVIGEDMKNSVMLALEHIGNKMGNLDVELIMEDDGFKPDIGKQKTDKLVKQDDVDFVAGYIWSHVLLASMNSVTGADKFLISANAGPSQIAGKRCHPNFFSTSWQNDQTPMAPGEYLNQEGVKSIYIMAPNYAAGKDMAAGVESVFKGEIKGKDLTKWGADAQLDFSAELAKAKASGAEALYVFYPGKAGGAFIKQYQQAGLQDKLAPVFETSISRRSIPLRFDDSEVELALDTGEIASGDARLPVSEADLELVSGKATRINELALALGERIPFVLQRRTKADRGYALHNGTSAEPPPVKARAIDLSPNMTAAQAFVVAASSCLAQVCANEAAVIAGRDPEGVHQMRVGVRRFRALRVAI